MHCISGKVLCPNCKTALSERTRMYIAEAKQKTMTKKTESECTEKKKQLFRQQIKQKTRKIIKITKIRIEKKLAQENGFKKTQ